MAYTGVNVKEISTKNFDLERFLTENSTGEKVIKRLKNTNSEYLMHLAPSGKWFCIVLKYGERLDKQRIFVPVSEVK